MVVVVYCNHNSNPMFEDDKLKMSKNIFNKDIDDVVAEYERKGEYDVDIDEMNKYGIK